MKGTKKNQMTEREKFEKYCKNECKSRCEVEDSRISNYYKCYSEYLESKGKADKDMFEKGFFTALATMNEGYDMPSVASDIIKNCGYGNYNCKNLDGFEKKQLRIINKEKDINLKGLKQEPK